MTSGKVGTCLCTALSAAEYIIRAPHHSRCKFIAKNLSRVPFTFKVRYGGWPILRVSAVVVDANGQISPIPARLSGSSFDPPYFTTRPISASLSDDSSWSFLSRLVILCGFRSWQSNNKLLGIFDCWYHRFRRD